MLGYIALGVLLAAVAVSADYPDVGYPPKTAGGSGYLNGGNGHPTHGNGGSGYPSGNGGYGGGYYPRFVYYPIPTQQNKKLTEVDKLFAQLADIDTELHIFKETFGNLAMRNGELFEEVVHIQSKGEQILNDESIQDEEIMALENLLDEIGVQMDELATKNMTISPISTGNFDNLLFEANRLTTQYASNVNQQSMLENLAAQIDVLKKRLNVDVTTSFKLFCADFEVQKEKDRGLKKLINSRKCETGTVSIHRDDSRATVLFQNDFSYIVPQVLYGIAGYQFDLRARGNKNSHENHGGFGGFGGYGGYGGYGSHGGHHGSGYGTSLEPNALGVFVDAFATRTGLTFQLTNLGFGDSDLLSVKVNYQACSVGIDIGI